MIVQSSGSDTERKIISILRVLSESSDPLGSITIARQLERYGLSMSERAIRYHLRITDQRGHTQPAGRDGRMITSKGLEELRMALAPDQVGLILDRLQLLAFQTTFDPKTRAGDVAINTSIFSQVKFKKALAAMRGVFESGLCVSDLVATASEGEKLGDAVIPSGKMGLATVCSVTVNGVLLKAGVPVDSRFAGVLEIKSQRPKRFIAVINYAGTSIDPSEQYIRAGMASVSEAARTGNGSVLANFRELPAAARALVADTVDALKKTGINGVYVLGNTGEPVCQIAVGLSRVGMVLLGGLNPVAAAVEAGIEVDNTSESGVIDYKRLVRFSDL